VCLTFNWHDYTLPNYQCRGGASVCELTSLMVDVSTAKENV